MGDGNAFGLGPTFESGTFRDGVEVRNDEFADPWERYTLPSELWDQSFNAFMLAYPALITDALTQWHEVMDGAQAMLVNHATNDVLILLNAVSDGDGRTAARTARALFEHYLHYKEVSLSAARAAQYEAHRHVTADQLSRAGIGLSRLPKKVRKKETDRLAALGRKASAPLQKALTLYGSAFRRGWTSGTSVHDLATRHGLTRDYDSYRILSGVMHGSAGALLGTRKEKGSLVTHRLGMDLQLAPLAFHEGFTWWRALLDELPSAAPPPDWAVGLRDATGMLLDDGYQEIFAACRRLDNRLWPAGPVPPKRVAVLALYPRDKIRWFLHDRPAGLLRPAVPISEIPDLTEIIETLRPQVGTAGGRPATAAVAGVRLEPIAERRPVHEAHLLIPPDTFGRKPNENGRPLRRWRM